MNIAYFEIRLSGITRFPKWVHNHIQKSNSELPLIFFYDQEDIDPSSIDLPGLHFILVKIQDISEEAITKLFKQYNIKKLHVCAQRIPDSFLVAIAKKLSIKTYMYQHGLYVPFMKREPDLFYKNIYKSYRYLKYALLTAKIIKYSRYKLLLMYIQIYLFGANRSEINFPSQLINVDQVLVYGEFWKEYHFKNLDYSYEQQHIVGAPDFSDIPILREAETIGKSICYIAQTLVEDGRLNREIMLTFIDKLSNAVKKNRLNLHIRLHPRSDITLYQNLPDNTVFTKKDFPKTEIYIGHYSSILSKATFLSNNIILVDFPGHEIPKYIKSVSTLKIKYNDSVRLVSSLAISLKQGVNEDLVTDNLAKQNFYFDSSIFNSSERVAKFILDEDIN